MDQKEITGAMAIHTLNQDSPPVGAPTLDQGELDKYLRLLSETRDSREALGYVERAVELAPTDLRVRKWLHGTLIALTDRDPFIEYLTESEGMYVVAFRNSRPVVIPKDRGKIEVSPPVSRTEGERIIHLLRWSVLGLIPAGLGAILFLPIVYLRALMVLTAPSLPNRESRLAIVALYLSSFLALVGAIISGLLLLHWIG